MTDTEYGLTYIFMWHSLSDACPKCRHLDGKEWRDQDLYQDVLWDYFFGNIWDLNANHPLTHPNCRCQLEVRVEFNPIEIPEWKEFHTLLMRCVL